MKTEDMKTEKNKKRLSTLDLVYIGIFTAVIAVCSWITIPLAIPITLQTLAICTASGLLGAKRGVLTVVAYILLGLIGVPVFSKFSAGVGVLFGVTGGYIIGFIFTALIIGIMVDKLGKKTWVYILSMVLGAVAYYIFGTVWFVILYNKGNSEAISIASALTTCVLPFIIPDLLKIAVSVFICKRLEKYVKS